MKRIAILGGTGMAGHVAVSYLEECGYDTYFMSLSVKHTNKSKAFNVEDTFTLNTWLEKIRPEIILNCLGVLQRESEERPDRAILINAHLPRYLEHKYSTSQVKIIHLSTDCVFSGKRGGYLETDIVDGESIYARTKALGEIKNNKDITFRMSIIGPDCRKTGSGLFNWFVKQDGDIKGYAEALWNGITTIELARAIDAAINQRLTGLYHLVNSKPIDKYNLLMLFQKIFNKGNVDIIPYDDFVTDKTLINTRSDFDFVVQPYSVQIKTMKEWIERHHKFYPHYKNII